MKFKIKILASFFALFAIIMIWNQNVSAFDGEILVPKALKKGDTICVLSLSRANTKRINMFSERIDSIVNDLKNRGFNVIVEEECFKNSELELGDGTEQLRADIFNKAVADPNIKAIFSIWGGYGAMHVLDKIDYESFRKNRKIFVGYSDVTAVELAILEKSGVITFHGPMIGATPNWGETKCFDALFDMLMNPRSQLALCNIDDETPFEAFKSGSCEAQVVGGNMCLTHRLIGTTYEPSYKNKILFFEDVGASALGVHRNLWQLKLAGRLNELSGIIIGTITPDKQETEEKILKACFDVMKDLKIPIIYNFHAGHIKNPLTLPIGATLKIDDEKVLVMNPVVE